MIFRLTFLFNFLKRSSVYLEWILRIIDILLPFLWDYFITLSLLAPIELQIFKTIRDCQHHPPLGHVWEQAPPGHTESQSGWDPHLVSRDPLPFTCAFQNEPLSLLCVPSPWGTAWISTLFLVLSQEVHFLSVPAHRSPPLLGRFWSGSDLQSCRIFFLYNLIVALMKTWDLICSNQAQSVLRTWHSLPRLAERTLVTFSWEFGLQI